MNRRSHLRRPPKRSCVRCRRDCYSYAELPTCLDCKNELGGDLSNGLGQVLREARLERRSQIT